jgi:hypothetical protein
MVKIIFAQGAQGQWALWMAGFTNNTVTQWQLLTSATYGVTWNTAQGLDAVRYFTSQGGTTPGGPLEWKDMSVR